LNLGIHFLGCVFTGGASGVLANNSSSGISIIRCIFDSQAGDALTLSSGNYPAVIHSNGFYGGTGNGINVTASGVSGIIANNYFSTFTGGSKAAVNNTSGTVVGADLVLAANAYYNCTAGYTGFGENFTIFDNGALASEAFNSPSTQDFSIKAVGQAIGYPGQFENNQVYQSYLDIGAAQHTASGGGGLISVPFPGNLLT
jgi:hypothetical protein